MFSPYRRAYLFNTVGAHPTTFNIYSEALKNTFSQSYLALKITHGIFMSEIIFSNDPDSLDIIRTLQSAGYEAVYVGGCVRDTLMGREPKDYDIATSATAEVVEGLFERTLAVGKSFGVMVVVCGEDQYEVATFRKDGEYVDGRRPQEVIFCAAKEDALRRDFTINALMYDPVACKLEDYVGGKDDLDAGIIRTVGRARDRFLEDHLRILRALRFAARTGFEIEEQTFAAVREMAGLTKLVSAERVGSELTLMLTGKNPEIALDLLERGNLLLHLLPEVALMRGTPQPEKFHPEGDVMEHTLIMLREFGQMELENDFEREVLAWSVLLHDVGKPPVLELSGRIRFNCHDRLGSELAGEILRRLKRPGKVIDAVCDIVGRHMHMGNLTRMRTAKFRRFVNDPLFMLHLKLHWLDCTASHNMLENYEYGLAGYRQEQLRPPAIDPLINGKDLIEMGYQPGPLFSKILTRLVDAQLEVKVHNRQEARIWVRNHFRDL